MSLGGPTATLGTDVSGLPASFPACLRQKHIGYEQFKRLIKTYLSGIEITLHCDDMIKLHILKISYLLTHTESASQLA